MRLAAEKRPEKWRWTEADVAALEGHNYMSYCTSRRLRISLIIAVPVIVPTFILPLVREVFEVRHGASERADALRTPTASRSRSSSAHSMTTRNSIVRPWTTSTALTT